MQVGPRQEHHRVPVSVRALLGSAVLAAWVGCAKAPPPPETQPAPAPTPTPVASRIARLTLYAPWPMELRLRRIFERYQVKHPDVIFQLYVAKPGPLIKRMKAGEVPDVFISMGPAGVETVRELGLVRQGTEQEILTQRVFVVCSDAMADTVKSVQDLARPEVTVVAMPPPNLSSGVYSHRALKEVGILDVVLAKERISPYSLFMKREVDVAIMYGECVFEEDLVLGDRVPRRTINVVEAIGEPFPVVAVPTKGEGPPDAAQAFIDFLIEPEPQSILNRR